MKRQKKFIKKLDSVFTDELDKNKTKIINIIDREKDFKHKYRTREGYFTIDEAKKHEKKLMKNLFVARKFLSADAFSRIFYDSMVDTFTMFLKSKEYKGQYWIRLGSTIEVTKNDNDNLIIRNTSTEEVYNIDYENSLILDYYIGELPSNSSSETPIFVSKP